MRKSFIAKHKIKLKGDIKHEYSALEPEMPANTGILVGLAWQQEQSYIY